MILKLFHFFCILQVFIACTSKTVKIINDEKEQLTATHQLKLSSIKRITLDSVSAPKPQYIQVFKDITGVRYFTFLNTYDNSIYFYDYNTLEFIKKIKYNKEGPDGILSPKGYHIKNMDSIYVYNMPFTEIVLADSIGRVLQKISLKGNDTLKDWPLYFPQYFPRTSNPFILTPGKLLFTGQYFLSIPDSMIARFKFNAQIGLESNEVDFRHNYPEELYGFGYNWEGGLFTEVFSELHPDGNKIIYSFPVSHDLYITGLDSNTYKKVYGGSNIAGTICSIDSDNPHKTPSEVILFHWAKQDMYAAIKYDPYRRVYYRFLRQGIPNATAQTRNEEKPIAVIIMDEDFNYLGETLIGTGEQWYWQNSFVTREGLNIEYIEKDFEEVYLTLKIFTIKKIENDF